MWLKSIWRARLYKSRVRLPTEEQMRKVGLMGITAAMMGIATLALAQTGPVAKACATDIQKICPNLGHNGQTRSCLEANRDKVSAACRHALDTTGGGRRRQ
jgi:hypothetical protein